MTYIDGSDLIKNPELNDDKLHLSDKPVNFSADKSNNIEDDNYLYAASATEMTGLARTIAHNEYEAQSYEEVFPYLPPIHPNGVITVPDTPVSEGIHAEYRREVTEQKANGLKADGAIGVNGWSKILGV